MDIVRAKDGGEFEHEATSKAPELVQELEELALSLDDPADFALFCQDLMDRLRDPERRGRNLVLSGRHE